MLRSAYRLRRTLLQIVSELLPVKHLMLNGFIAVAFGCAASAQGNEEQITQNPGDKIVALPGQRVDPNTLAQVRGGSLLPTAPVHEIGVILWDERRIPPPPVRHHIDARVTAQMDILDRR